MPISAVPSTPFDADAGPVEGPDPLARPSWVAFRYTTPDSSKRAAAWRRLKSIDALNLQRGTWAVTADPERLAELADVADWIASVGGTSSTDLVDELTADTFPLSWALDRACERLWEEFFTQADSYRARLRLDGNERPLTDCVHDLAGLYATFGDAVQRDLVQSEAVERAERRLAEYARVLIATREVDLATWCRSQRTFGHQAELASSWPLDDGTRGYVVRVRPTVDPIWEAGFREFEARTYRPSPTRQPLRAGTFRWRGGAETLAEEEERIARRLSLFEASLA